MNVTHTPLFPTFVSLIECDCFSSIQPDLLKWIANYKTDKSGVIISNRGGWQSEDNIASIESFQPFVEYMRAYINHGLRDFYNLEYRLLNMWININYKGNYNIAHCHPQSDLSGVLWVKCPKNCGSLDFYCPDAHVNDTQIQNTRFDIKNEYNLHGVYSYATPQEGTIVVFPSHLMHGVDPNESDEERISIAFNLDASPTVH